MVLLKLTEEKNVYTDIPGWRLRIAFFDSLQTYTRSGGNVQANAARGTQ